MRGVNRKSLMWIIKTRDPDSLGISRKITQSESQKLDFILPILDYLVKNKKFSAAELKQRFHNFNHKSIDRTISLLKKHNLIFLHKIESKNKKIYRIKSANDIGRYKLDLLKYREFKIFSKSFKQPETLRAVDGLGRINDYFNKLIQKGKRKSEFLVALPNDFFTKKLIVGDEQLSTRLKLPKNHLKTICLNDIGASLVIQIIHDFRAGGICMVCFKENKLKLYTEKDQELVCSSGHVSTMQLSNSSEFSSNEIFDPTKNSKKLTDAMFEYQKGKFLHHKK